MFERATIICCTLILLRQARPTQEEPGRGVIPVGKPDSDGRPNTFGVFGSPDPNR
jgi:hypothetical protein